MIKIERLARKFAEKMATQLDFDDDKKAVVAYGLTAILQMIAIFIITSIIGITFDFWYECISIFLIGGIIRKYTGGAHAKTMTGCIIISVLTITLLSAFARYLLNSPINIFVNVGLSIFIYIICFIIFYLRVPVDSPNKPIVKPEKIRRLRKQSFTILTILFFVSMLFEILAISYQRFYSIAFSIRLAMLWQLITLTKSGTLFLDNIDSLINKIIGNR